MGSLLLMGNLLLGGGERRGSSKGTNPLRELFSVAEEGGMARDNHCANRKAPA